MYHKDFPTHHVSNSVIENYNKMVKGSWFKPQSKIRPAVYIDTTKNHLNDIVDALDFPELLKSFIKGKLLFTISSKNVS